MYSTVRLFHGEGYTQKYQCVAFFSMSVYYSLKVSAYARCWNRVVLMPLCRIACIKRGMKGVLQLEEKACR